MTLSWQQLAQPFAVHALLAALLTGVLAGAVGPFVVARRMAFGVHGLAELSFTGAAAGLVTGAGVVLGALVGSVLLAALLATLAVRERDRDTVTGVLFAAGLGLGVLLLTGYAGFTREATAVLFGSIVAVSAGELRLLAAGTAVGLLCLAGLWRPLRFASLDPDVAAARGVQLRLLGALFLVLVAVVVTETVQLAGTVLVLSLLTVPAAAASRLTVAPAALLALSVSLAVAAAVGGVVLSVRQRHPSQRVRRRGLDCPLRDRPAGRPPAPLESFRRASPGWRPTCPVAGDQHVTGSCLTASTSNPDLEPQPRSQGARSSCAQTP